MNEITKTNVLLPIDSEESIENRIFTIRGVQVMLDVDIAALFRVDVKRLNQQMKRNPGRFPRDFCFQLSREDISVLRSQIATFTEKNHNRKYFPFVYTEQGIIALAGVLRSGVAEHMAVEISRVFVSMRRFILENGDIIQRVAELQSRQIAFENETAKKFETLFSYVDEKRFPKQMTFFDGQWFDAYDFISALFEKAEISILLIDPYCDRHAFMYCAKKKAGVTLKICLGEHANLSDEDIEAFAKQYGPITIKQDVRFHDRYLILDRKECYHIGTSLNHAGKLVYGIYRIEDRGIIGLLIHKCS